MRRHGLSNDAKQAIASFIAATSIADVEPWDCDAFCKEFGDVRRRLERLGDETVWVIEEIIETGGSSARLAAAEICLATCVHVREFEEYNPVLIRNCENIIANALLNTTDAKKLRYICNLISTCQRVPKAAVGKLLQLLVHPSEIVRVSAAAAACWDEKSLISGLEVLRTALRSDDPDVLAIVSTTLLWRQLHREDAITAAIKAFREGRGETRYGMVRVLHDLGPLVLDAIPILSELVRNKEVPDYIRGRAAAAIGSIARDKPDGAELLKKALRSKRWELVTGAADGLALKGCFGDKEVAALAAMLSVEDENLRGAAAYGLKKIGPGAEAAIPAMLARFGTESNREVCKAIIAAFGAIGPVAIIPLLDLLSEFDMRQYPLCIASLHAIGSAAAETIVETMLSHPDGVIRIVGVQILRELGVVAAPAVPMLAKLLDEAENAEVAYEIVVAVLVCGPAARAAADSIVRALVRWDDDVAEAAEMTLRLIGAPAALAALRIAEMSAVGDAKQRIIKATASIGPQRNEAFNRLESYQRDDLLRLFVLVGGIFDHQGETSWHTVAKEVSAKITFKRTNGRPFGTSDKSIAKAVNDLGAIVLGEKGRLTTHGNNTKGELTPAGMTLLREARGYLEQKYGDGRSIIDVN